MRERVDELVEQILNLTIFDDVVKEYGELRNRVDEMESELRSAVDNIQRLSSENIHLRAKLQCRGE